MTDRQLDLVLRRALVDGRRVDIGVSDGRIVGIAAEPNELAADATVDLAGRTVVAGLCDAHVHFWAWATRHSSADVTDRRTPEEVVASLREFAGTSTAGIVRGVGLRYALWDQLPSRELLDSVAPGRPVVVVSRDWHSAWLSGPAFAAAGVPATPSGLVYEDVAWAAIEALGARDDEVELAAARRAADDLAARGVTEIVDFELTRGWERWQRYAAATPDGIGLRVFSAVVLPDLDDAIAAGRRTGSGTGLVRTGPVKVFADGALGSLTAWCRHPYGVETTTGLPGCHGDELVEVMRTARANGFEIAVHAIGDAANHDVLNAFERAGANGRIEHCQLLDDEDVPRFAQLGVTASVQPLHAYDDQPLLDRHWADRRARAYRFADLVDSGADVVFGSDAPIAEPDPWRALAVATGTDRVPGLAPVPFAAALAASTRRSLRPGDHADFVVLEEDPRVTRPRSHADAGVVGTLVAGRWSYRAF